MNRSALLRFRRNRPACLGAALVALLTLAALLGPVVVSQDPNTSDFLHGVGDLGPAPPSSLHWLGTDTLFRDLAARLLHGARISLAVAILATALAVGIGTLVGLLAGSTWGTRFRFLDERWRVYQHLIKSTARPFTAPACSEPIAHEALARRASYLNGRRS
ncbi:MAG TPA: hypothetical protein PLI95_21935, partial [Polyangiaceae bacterium]|nr:hypothetical protein [Polyangiaceae bacterium]